MRAAAAFLLAWVGFFWLWMLFVGAWDLIDGAAGACAAFLAAVAAVLVGWSSRTPLGLPAERLRAGASVPVVVVEDFVLVMRELVRSLVRRRVTRGRYVARPFDPGPKTTSPGMLRRAWTIVLAGYSPNAYPVDIDVGRGEVLLHDLVLRRRSEEPA